MSRRAGAPRAGMRPAKAFEPPTASGWHCVARMEVAA